MALKDNLAKSVEQDPLLRTKEAIEQPLTVLWDQIEAWQQDNHYIHSGYRPASNSYSKSAASLGYLHNESVNIWSHLLSAISFAIGSGVFYQILRPRYRAASQEDVLVFGCFFLGAVGCMGMSATYHAISNHSQVVSKFGNRLDYLGIVFLIVGSFIPSIYYGFSCDPQLRDTYWAMITTIGAGCGITSMAPQFASPKWRLFRASMFVAMGLSAVVPVFHGLKIYGLERMNGLIALPWLVSQGALYILGAALYAVRVFLRRCRGTAANGCIRCACLNASSPVNSTSGAALIRSFISWSSLQQSHILLG